MRLHGEVCTAEGRADAAVETRSRVYVMEFELDRSAEDAVQQVLSKRYHRAFWLLGKPVVAGGVNFSTQSRNIEKWKAVIAEIGC
ncbi:MAG: PD-(D/E)XK nuclease domain-containing protein [Saprospiraceae bacterium]|nr:PD-(D/E)XK nuclease domain-containing protein [Saprospiraceae bacterium]MDW8484740.1 PD-(D/E)XK nuclease domain-containing protein [Saprospiraceae bacterium]